MFMSSDIKKPDRLNISKNAKEIIDSIDSTNYFSLGDKTTSRSELFLFAMALGIDTIPTQLENTHPGGLILEKSIDSTTLSSMYANFISSLQDEQLDEITNKGKVFKMAQEFANTGFENIDDYMKNKKNQKDLAWELLKEMDNQYNNYFSE